MNNWAPADHHKERKGVSMPSPRETILSALFARLSALPATGLRGDVLPERLPGSGLLILRDGEPGEPEITLSPPRYHYQHRAEIEAVVQGVARDGAFDALCTSVGLMITADRTLGSLCDWVGNIIFVEVTYSNGLDRIETIWSDGRIEGADPGMAALTGRMEVRFADTTLITQALDGTPYELVFAWTQP